MRVSALILSVMLGWLFGCTGLPAPHDSSTRVLNEMKTARPAATPAVVPPAPVDHRVAALEQRVRELEAAEARARDLEGMLEAERAKVASLSAGAQKAPAVTRTYDDFVKRLQPDIDKGNIHVARVGDRVTIALADRLLFESGSDRLRTEGLHVLEQVGQVLHGVPDMRVQVNGHTDNIPIGGKLLAKFPSNLALSQARAEHVSEALRGAGVAPMNLEATGYGDQRPIGNNMVEEGRRKNRRVELIVFPREN